MQARPSSAMCSLQSRQISLSRAKRVNDIGTPTSLPLPLYGLHTRQNFNSRESTCSPATKLFFSSLVSSLQCSGFSRCLVKDRYWEADRERQRG